MYGFTLTIEINIRHYCRLKVNQGIYERKLTSDKSIPLKLDNKSYDCELLGLMHAHIKVDNFGVRVKVWTFQHLTIQEYMAAFHLQQPLAESMLHHPLFHHFQQAPLHVQDGDSFRKWDSNGGRRFHHTRSLSTCSPSSIAAP